MISVLLPTRGRPDLVASSVATLLIEAIEPDDVQICYAVDADDPNTIARVGRMARSIDHVAVSPTCLGYAGLHDYVNGLADEADGDWLLLWNDDAVMRTPGWDRIIESYSLDVVLSLRCNHAEGIVAFPVVPRRFIEKLGHFSLSPHNDTWWQYIGDGLELTQWIDVDVVHDRFDITGNNNDETYARTRQQSLEARTADRFWNESIELIELDKMAIMKLLLEEA